jgi:hypothetical protein
MYVLGQDASMHSRYSKSGWAVCNVVCAACCYVCVLAGLQIDKVRTACVRACKCAYCVHWLLES